VANQFIKIIADHGRRFFHHHGFIGHFEIGKRGHVFFVDSYSRKAVYLRQGEWRHFNEGGTMRDIVERLLGYIRGKTDELPLDRLGPWPSWYGGGDLWGYGMEEAEKVRCECRKLAESISKRKSHG
jgi:hypothetical protein